MSLCAFTSRIPALEVVFLPASLDRVHVACRDATLKFVSLNAPTLVGVRYFGIAVERLLNWGDGIQKTARIGTIMQIGSPISKQTA